MTERTRRAIMLSELLTGPAEDLRFTNLDSVAKTQTADADANVEALWTAVEALWLHHKALRDDIRQAS